MSQSIARMSTLQEYFAHVVSLESQGDTHCPTNDQPREMRALASLSRCLGRSAIGSL